MASALSLTLISFVCCFALFAEATHHHNVNFGPFVLFRLKRSPYRAFTYSGFNARRGGLTALASSHDYYPYYYPSSSPSYSYPVSSRSSESVEPDPTSNYSPGAEFSVEPTPDQQQGGAPPADNAEYPVAPSSDPAPAVPDVAPPAETAAVQAPLDVPKPPAVIEDDDEPAVPVRSKSSSKAQFNAYFPIIVGTGYGGKPISFKEDGTPVFDTRGSRGGTTVIANSISNGRSSVASSHAVAYGHGGYPEPAAAPRVASKAAFRHA